MKKPLIIGILAAASIAGAVSLVKVDGSKPAPAAIVTQAEAAETESAPVVIRMAQLALSQPLFDYERGPRIIHVPQNDRVASRRPDRAAIDDDTDDVVLSAPARPRAVPPKPRIVHTPPPPRVAATPPQPPAAATPRWKLRGETPPVPPPSEPRRAVLSAPPISAGPTPLRPTPRFDSKAADRGEKFAAPAPVARQAVVSETQPPLGYSPPALPEQPSDEVPSAAPEEAQPPQD